MVERRPLLRALRRELELAVRGVHTPVGLVRSAAVVTNALWLPWLVEGLEVEDVDAPGEHAADALLEEGLSVLGTGLGGTVVRSTV